MFANWLVGHSCGRLLWASCWWLVVLCCMFGFGSFIACMGLVYLVFVGFWFVLFICGFAGFVFDTWFCEYDLWLLNK